MKTLKEIVNDPSSSIVQDVVRNNSTKAGDVLTCIRCKKYYKRGVWDFYSLCPGCFSLFDEQKMAGRFQFLLAKKKEDMKKWYEDPRAWINEEKKT